jgi:hypothetical protein
MKEELEKIKKVLGLEVAKASDTKSKAIEMRT